jgi:uncharacterized membrane protein YqiK
VESLGSQAYTALQLMQVIGDRQVRVVPDVSVSGNGQGSGLMDSLMGMLVWKQAQEMHGAGDAPVNSGGNGSSGLPEAGGESADNQSVPPAAKAVKPLVIKDGNDMLSLDDLLK